MLGKELLYIGYCLSRSIKSFAVWRSRKKTSLTSPLGARSVISAKTPRGVVILFKCGVFATEGVEKASGFNRMRGAS